MVIASVVCIQIYGDRWFLLFINSFSSEMSYYRPYITLNVDFKKRTWSASKRSDIFKSFHRRILKDIQFY